MNALSEQRESLWVLTVSPVVWAAHLLVCYVTAAIWCAKVVGRDGSLATVRLAIAAYTVAALVGIGVTGWRGFRKQRAARAAAAQSDDTPRGRHRFLGFATLLLSILSAVAVVYTALAAVFIQSCH